MILLQKKKRVRLETHLAYHDYVKAFDRVKRENRMKNYKEKISQYIMKRRGRNLRWKRKEVDKQWIISDYNLSRSQKRLPLDR
jgi:hypothetical protein